MSPQAPDSTPRPARRRILLVGTSPGAFEPIGGLEVYLLRLASYLGDLHEVTISSHPGRGGLDRAYRRPSENFERFEPSSVDRLDQLARTHDLVLVNQWRYLVTAPERTVLMLHNGIREAYPEKFSTEEGRRHLRAELALPAAIAACSSWAAGTFSEVVEREVHVLYPPIDPVFLETPACAKRPVVGYIGRMSISKGVDLLPQIARRLEPYGLELEATMFTTDPGVQEILEEHLSTGLVRGVAPYTDPKLLAKYMASLAAVVKPSRFEAFGLSALEAQAAGTFVVSSSAEGLSEAVLPGGGVLTDGTVEGLVEGLRAIQGKRPGEEVRAEIQSRFAVANTANRLLSLI